MLLSSIVKSYKKVRVLCVGDVMLDHFLYGKVERISPEAPVPVFNFQSEKRMLGGAGNVVANLHSLGCAADLICFIGDDAAGREVRLLLEAVCENPLPVVVPGFPTIEKTRVIAGNNHLLRIDNERRFDGTADLCGFLGPELDERVKAADIVLLSDYAKGMLSPERCRRLIEACRSARRPVIIDPKGDDYSKYARATVVKPNLREFNQATGMDCRPTEPGFREKLCVGAKKLFEKHGIENLLVTLSEHGMAFVSAKNPDEVFQLPTEAREVFDVSGAGDTSLAAFGASLAAGADIQDAMKLANVASGVAVGKLGTSCVTGEEILDALSRRRSSSGPGWKQKRKIVSRREAAEVAAQCREQGRKVGFTNGCFDLLHQGHLHSLMQARQECDVLMVGLNTDASIKRLKGPERPIQDEKTRALLLASLEFVDYVVMFDDDTALPLVDAIRPDLILKEGYTIDRWPEAQFVESYGGRAVTLSRLEGYSTTSTIRRMKG
ncbi:bifunctional heptose 7-phosphate kinase/heptose 1-phosphate adenyltransferase [Mailhella massiliensis]|uniref:Bifunctional protein HldE n=1 Tax=Mailhella massiliensis TaxID=1903261 RepID=A0A921AW13_9BACT|nr:bifunctional heptose 7-phosphate kinase/heptose 1-phosphate adenyltransferase [Mailhella massiliensis]HJD96884.1 bifunctional heptose 7-phosphate kinase/heptose 1-phosphate adenyltransferase [Mailhella massiliensis]